MEIINEPLVKIVPAGERVSAYSPYFAKLSEFGDALAKGHNLNDRFGLPVKSEAPVYDVYRIDPKGSTEVFVSEVAPTSELGGQVTHAGGARQYLVPNRSLFTEAVRVGSLGNDLALHNERVVGKGLGAAIAPASESADARGVRPGAGTVARGLGAAAAAATAYDIADTAHDVGRLRAQGNETAAEDRITRFAAQNLGGWGGAAAGFGAGAAAGVESGPGLLVTGAVGGIIGAVAGDQVATYIRDYKINHQDGRQGNTWTFDPDHPEHGWTRTEGSVLDRALGRARTVTADAALSDELTYKASSRAIDLALGAPPQNQDPYRLPVDAAEVGQRQPFETGRAWTCDPQSGQWQQEITELVDGRVPITHHEPATPQQAEALEQRSQAIIARNARQTSAAMAAQFQAAYEHNGWAQHGPPPEAVTEALRHPGRVVGSDGNLYERNAQGQWTHDGVLWDSQANGNLRQELDAACQTQAVHPSPRQVSAQQQETIPTLETVMVTASRTPDAPARTAITPVPDLASASTSGTTGQPAPALPQQRQPQPAPPHSQEQATPAPMPARSAGFTDPGHAGHATYQRILREVHYMEAGQGIAPGPHSEKIAAALLNESVAKGLHISQVRMGADGNVRGIQQLSAFDTPREVSIVPRQAQGLSMQEYAVRLESTLSSHLAGKAPAAAREPAQAQASSAMSMADQVMFAHLRRGTPGHIGDDQVAQSMLAAKRSGIDDASKIGGMTMAGDRLWIIGTGEGQRVAIDVSRQAPPVQDALQQLQVVNQQREQQLAMDQQRSQQAPGRGAPVMG